MAPAKTDRSKPAQPKVAAAAAPNVDPLADYFFIAGIESSQVYDARGEPPVLAVEDTIDEDRALEISSTNPNRPRSPASPTSATHNSTTPTTPIESKRRSHYSFETRKSIGSIINNKTEHNSSPSNRSSLTVRAVQALVPGIGDDDFEDALKKFISERDSFLDDIHPASGNGSVPFNKKQRPRAIRIASEEIVTPAAASGLKSGIGSVRKRLSAMNSTRRQPSVVGRQASQRTSRRLSGYNSVIPTPAPFQVPHDMHPLKRRYEPGLLDRYPTQDTVDESKHRNPFPDYVPMFAFPNDVTVVSSDERPRSTWHGFAMTNADNSKLHGICLIVWTPLNQNASMALEQQCEDWRKKNMSDEERELASSLGERLSNERAKLSRLLAELPTITSGSAERDNLEDEISTVEERIALMADLLRPVRHGAASKIDGLTEGDSGFWIPRAYGILGRDASLTRFWKEWLKSVVVPMMNGAILRVPPSSPKVGLWQPLERYVVNLCIEAPLPITSITQVEVSVREIRLYARKDAINEIPGSRNVDLYALFRCLTIPNIIALFEFALSESRIILLSSHTSMLQLACSALTMLLYPFKWTGVLIPVLPARLLQALDAPCPYIAGIERRYENVELPSDDYCIVDLDNNTIEATAEPIALPRPQRRKLVSLLQLAAPHHNRYGVPIGPPRYAIETFPYDSFSSESPQVFSQDATPSTLASYVSESSTFFGDATNVPSRSSVYNAFMHHQPNSGRSTERPSTGSTGTSHSHSSSQSPPSPIAASPVSSSFFENPFSRSDSGYALQASLREKRSAHFNENSGHRNASISHNRVASLRRPSQTTFGHQSTLSTSTAANGASAYAPSVYAQSTLAASTIMPQFLVQPVKDNDTTKWIEGHCLTRRKRENKMCCTICDERFEEEVFKCTGCNVMVHARCVPCVHLVCPVAFRADQVQAAFIRCFASLLYTYRKHLHPASGERRAAGLLYQFNMDQFLRSVPHGDGDYMNMLRETQAFNEFIHERETTRADDPSIRLFDEVILSKRNRGKTSLFSRSHSGFLADKSDHLWRSAAIPPPNGRIPGDSYTISGRMPAKLDTTLMKEPRSIQGVPRLQQVRARRKPVASMLGIRGQTIDA